MIQITALLAVAFTAMYVTLNPSLMDYVFPRPPAPPKQTQIKVGEAFINIEVADTQVLRTKGLSSRDSLASDSGMLFIFPETKKHRFWMKGMKFSLDFIFINEGKVVDLLRNVPPPLPKQADNSLPVYEPVAVINMMLETNSGFIDAHNIKVSDNVFLIQQ